jgi:U3 small nucleolar RNA-associated protein 10
MSLSSRAKTQQFLALPQLHQEEALSRPECFSFLMRVCSTNSTTAAKVAGLNAIRTKLKDTAQTNDVIHLQNFIPYLVVALSDPSAKVRQAGAGLCRSMCILYEDRPTISSSPSDYDVKIAVGNIYGPDMSLKHQLQQNDVSKFLKSILVPALEDAALDSEYVKQLIVDVLNEKREGITGLNKTFRSDICAFFASHLVTPVFRVKLVLLEILNAVGKTAATARSQLVLPFAHEYFNLSEPELLSKLNTEGTPAADMDKAVLGNLTHRSEAEIKLIKDVSRGTIGQREPLVPCAFDRITQLFPLAKGSQIQIAEWLLELAMGSSKSDSVGSKDEALQTLRNLQLPTEVLVYLVETLPKATDLQEQPSTKKRRMSNNSSGQLPEVDHAKVQAGIRKITLVLELVETSDPGKHPQLLRGLFHALSDLHHFKTMLGSELVYTFQILLGCILSVVDGLRMTPNANIDRTVIRTDLIVECVRTTSSTQIHNTALLLVSSLASWAPELVLHCVMPLFTFMSSTLLRQSDSFSAHVTDQTVERIVPPLAASLKKKGKRLVVGASELLLSFTAAFEHIPLHRRAALFKHLVETLGVEETLFAVVAMLIERYGNESSVSSFVMDLTNQFSGLTAINAAKQYLDLISDTLKPKRGLSDVLLSFGDKDVTERVESQGELLAGLANLLRNLTLRERLATELAREDDNSRTIQSTYASLLEHTMQLNRDVSANMPLRSSASALLLSVLGLMPTKDFIQSSAQLMQTGTDQTRQQVFRALEARVSAAKASDSATRQIFLDVLPNCGVFLREDQPVATRHAAVSCIDQICEKYGKTDRDAVLAVAQQVAGHFALGSDDVSLRVISILCLASMVEILGDDCIPILPNVLNQVLKCIDAGLASGSPSWELQAAGFALLNSVLDHLPWMLADQYLDQALLLADQAVRLESPIDALQEFGNLVATKVQATQLFTTIQRTFFKAFTLGVQDDQGLQYHLRVFHAAIQHHSKATITKNARLIFNILLEVFDLRRSLDPQRADAAQSNDLYNLVDKIAMDVTLKLNDATFRPFFITLVEWATKPSKDMGAANTMALRQISLYSFSLTLFNQLQSIVTSYAAFLLENAFEILKRPPLGTLWDVELTDLVLRTLSSSFNHDQDEFWQTPAHFDAVAMPLIDQLQQPKGSQLMDQIITTITDLAAAARSQEHLKSFNAAIMVHLRNRNSVVRLAAVKCERSLTERLAVDWLDLLPEMLPIISELHEDDDEEVERETLRWATEIEEITGESLDPMLA